MLGIFHAVLTPAPSFYPTPWWEWFVLPGFIALAALYYFASSERRLGRRKARLIFTILSALIVFAMVVYLVNTFKSFASSGWKLH